MTSDGRRGGTASRVAGGLMIVVGLLNVALGILSLAGDQLNLTVGAAGTIIVLGAVVVAAGTLVWRGLRVATLVSFTVFAGLLVFQLSELVADGAGAGAAAEDPVVRFSLLVPLVIATGAAAWRLRRSDR